MKKFLAMALSLAMVLSLAACGSKTEAPAENTDAPAESDTTDASESTEVSVVNPGKLTVATSPDFAPYEFYAIDANGDPSWTASTWLWPVTLLTTWVWSWMSSPWTSTAC